MQQKKRISSIAFLIILIFFSKPVFSQTELEISPFEDEFFALPEQEVKAEPKKETDSVFQQITEESQDDSPDSEYEYKPVSFSPVKKFSVINVGATGMFFADKTLGYPFAIAAESLWYTTKFTAPFYEGVGLKLAVGFPGSDFPKTYKALNSSANINPPVLTMFEILLPAGFEIFTSEDLSFFSEIAFTTRFNILLNLGIASSVPAFSIGGRIKTGINFKFLGAAFAVQYDSLCGIIPEVNLYAKIGIKPKKIKTKTKKV